MIYYPESNLWMDVGNNTFIKNEFSLIEPSFIEVSDHVWSGVWKGSCYKINWDKVDLPVEIIAAIKHVAMIKLSSSRVAVTYIGAVKNLLLGLESCWPKHCQSFYSFGITEFSIVWDVLTSNCKSIFRQLFKEISNSGKFGADSSLIVVLKRWKARTNVKTLKGVLEWNPLIGALTSAELELLRNNLMQRPLVESAQSHAIRVLCWILIETMKRSQQILSIRASGMVEMRNAGITEYFLEIPKAKAQAGSKPELWIISSNLAEEIQSYSRHVIVRDLQNQYDRLIVWDSISLTEREQLSSAIIKSQIIEYVRRFNCVSPRTGKPLHITPYRLRHTSATHMAMQGVSRDVIQHILEHDDSTSADAYIDAVGSELIPAIERVDRNLGDIFKGLNDIFFKGQVVKKLAKEKIFIPIFSANPMPVGSCGLDSTKHGTCNKQPFTACYDGCPNFLAWHEANHAKALQYVESEFERWSSAEGHNARSKAIKDFERLHHAISEVISQIDERKSHAAA